MTHAASLLTLLACGPARPEPTEPSSPAPLPAAVEAPASDLARLQALTQACDPLPGATRFKTDASRAEATVQLCRLEGAIWWRADADIDCDGAPDPRCAADRTRRSETSAKTSTGAFINSAEVPYLVVPLPSNGFRPKAHGIKTGWSGYGSAGVILYGDAMVYAPYADAGPAGVIGELSYAAAVALGIDPDPNRSGVEGDVTYIVFTGDDARVEPVESAAQARAVGERLLARLLDRTGS